MTLSLRSYPYSLRIHTPPPMFVVRKCLQASFHWPLHTQRSQLRRLTSTLFRGPLHLCTRSEASYGAILAPYLEDPSNCFIISSDFCHWGKRFGFTFHQQDQVGVHVRDCTSLLGASVDATCNYCSKFHLSLIRPGWCAYTS